MAPPRRAGWLNIRSFRLLLFGCLSRISSVAQLVMRDNIYGFPHPLRGSFVCINWPLGADIGALCRPFNHPLLAAMYRRSLSACKVTIHQKSSTLGIRCNFNPRVIKGLNSAMTPSTSFLVHYSLSTRHLSLHNLSDGQRLKMNIIRFPSTLILPTHNRSLLPLITYIPIHT